MSEEAADPLRIDWASARVQGRRLTVELAGEAPRGLRKRIDGLLALIEPKAGEWGSIEVRRGSITVAEVQDGAERDLRHLLESVVMQINSDLGLGTDSRGNPSDGAPAAEDAEQTADREMGERFREFAGPPD
jgi:hypothetical protein